jgi:transcriptional regulator with XRE-family HTH domain
VISLAQTREAMASFGRELHTARKSRELSLREVGEAVGSTKQVLSRVESGIWIPDAQLEKRLREWVTQEAS